MKLLFRGSGSLIESAMLGSQTAGVGHVVSGTSVVSKVRKDGYLAFKRLLDVVLAGAMLVLFLPLMALIAGWIWLRGGVPVLYAHARVGKGGRVFPCLKFRTMVEDADAVLAALLARDPLARRQWELHRKLDADPRIIPEIGPLLRKTSLDELPQLWNVLRGDMSLVGPRPVPRDELDAHYDEGEARTAYLKVKPGLTGLWQVSGRSDTTYRQRVEMDTDYVRRASIALDLQLLLQTANGFVSGRLAGGR